MNEKEEKATQMKTRVEGQKAVDALFEQLDKDGILVHTEQKTEKNLSNRVKKLEHEVEFLKDIIARALKVKNEGILKG